MKPAFFILKSRIENVVPQIRSLVYKGGIAITDQGVFSGSNFVLNILLARWLSDSDYGLFVLIYSLIIFISGFHNALILEPLSVLGPSIFVDKINSYIRLQVKNHFILTGCLSLLIIIISLFLKNNSIVSALVSAGIALPFILFVWLLRRIFYVLHVPLYALLTSLFFAVFLILGIAFWPYRNTAWSFFILGISSFLCTLLAIVLKTKCKTTRDSGNINWSYQIYVNWNFGKTIILAACLYAFGSQIQLFIMGFFSNVQMAGEWRALQNFTLPMLQISAAISTLTLPLLSKEFGQSDWEKLYKKGKLLLLGLLSVSIIYELLLLVFSQQAENILYQGKFKFDAWMIPLLGLTTILSSLEVGFATLIRSFQKSIYHLVSGIVTAIAGLIFAPLLIASFGLLGAIISQLFVFLIDLGSTIIMFRKWSPFDKNEVNVPDP